MSDLQPIELKNSKILLRQTMPGDALALFTHYFSSKAAAKFLSREPYKDIEQAASFLQEWTMEAWNKAGSPFAWVIANADNSQPVGVFLVFPKSHGAEIHYGISEQHVGQGYATEACCLVTSWLLGYKEIEKVRTAVDLEHLATQRVLEKSGFQKEGILKAHVVLPAFGTAPRDAISYVKSKRA